MLGFGPVSDPADHVLAREWPEDATRIRVAAAFASETGGRYLANLLGLDESPEVSKQWLVGIENGLTQPEALSFLSGLPNSEVRVPHGVVSLQSPGLRGPRFFHPKLYAYDSPAGLTLVSASGNLTEGGLAKNIEQFLTWAGPPDDQVAADYDTWWQYWWERADPADSSFLESYEAKRATIQPPPPAGGAATGPIEEPEPAPSDLKTAQWMWIEATRPPEGGANNQLELMLTAHHFFYPDADEPPRETGRSLRFIDHTGNVYDNPERIVHYNGPPMMKKGNSMWRVRLPTENEGLTGYQQGDVAIRFERTNSADAYGIQIAALGSSDAQAWVTASAKIAQLSGPPARRMGWG